MPMTVISWKPIPGFRTIGVLAPRPSMFGCISAVAMPHACTTQRTIVR